MSLLDASGRDGPTGCWRGRHGHAQSSEPLMFERGGQTSRGRRQPAASGWLSCPCRSGVGGGGQRGRGRVGRGAGAGGILQHQTCMARLPDHVNQYSRYYDFVKY